MIRTRCANRISLFTHAYMPTEFWTRPKNLSHTVRRVCTLCSVNFRTLPENTKSTITAIASRYADQKSAPTERTRACGPDLSMVTHPSIVKEARPPEMQPEQVHPSNEAIPESRKVRLRRRTRSFFRLTSRYRAIERDSSEE